MGFGVAEPRLGCFGCCCTLGRSLRGYKSQKYMLTSWRNYLGGPTSIRDLNLSGETEQMIRSTLSTQRTILVENVKIPQYSPAETGELPLLIKC
jgi:hypothetical protein